MASINFRKIICLLLVVIITASFALPLPVLAKESEKTHSDLLKDVIAGVLTVEEAFGTLDAATVPEIVGYDSAVERTHIQRLYEEEGDDLNKIVFLNADGSHTAYIYDHPVKYVDGAGKIKDITLDIAESNVTGQFETAASSSVTTFSRNVTDGIGLRGNNTTISLVPHLPVATAKTMSATKSTDNAVAKQIDSKRIAYTYDDKTSLEYSLTYTGFKEDIVVSEYTGQTEYDFTLYTNGLKLVEINESFYLVDASGVTKAQLGDIIIFTADDKNNTMGDMVAQTVVENQEYLLTIVVDPEFLADKATAYPIRIDPTVEICYDNNGNGAIEDVTINSGGGSDGTAYSLSIGLRQSYGIARILMKFPGLNFGSLGTNAIITDASVEIRDLMCESTPLDVYCYVFSGNEWTESTANWSNVSPNSISTFLSSKTISYESGTQQPNWQAYAFDITAAVEGWRAGTCDPDKGIILKASSSVENGSTYNYKTLASYNRSAYKPTLSVTYTNGAYLLDEGTYYLNNLYYGDYLRYSSSSVTATSGLISSLGNSIRWELRNVYGGYVIQSKTDPTKYLAVPDTQSSSSVQVMTITDSVVPERCIWRMTLSSQGGCVLRSQYNSRYLYWDGSGLHTSTDLGDTNSTLHSTRVWRTLSTSYYGNTSNTTYREFSEYSDLASCELNVGQTGYLSVVKYYSNETWCSPSDFTYSGYSSAINLNPLTGEVTAKRADLMIATATHKVTNISVTFPINVSELLIYQTAATYYNDSNGNLASDLLCGDLTEDELRDLSWISWADFTGQSPNELRSTWENMCTSLFSSGTLSSVVSDMIEHFMSGHGQPYSNDYLTSAVVAHQNTTTYTNAVQECIQELLSEQNGNITTLLYTAADRDNSLLRNEMDDKEIYSPVYNMASDITGGLKICLDSLWGVRIEVTEYIVNGTNYECTIHYTFYDHFGLDANDVEDFGFLAGFRAWYILQHYSEYDQAYQPFLTLIEFEKTITGTIS